MNATSTEGNRSAPLGSYWILVLLVAVCLGIGVATHLFLKSERARDLNQWQVRLSIVADSRKAAVDDWLGQHWEIIRGLAENASLQIYMSELSLMQGGAADAVEPEAEYLEALLTATAQQGGFMPKSSAGGVDANVERSGQAGLALVDADGNMLASTQDMLPPKGRFQAAMEEAAKGEPVLMDVFETIGGRGIGFVMPVYGVQQSPESSGPLGFVVGIKLMEDGFFNLLKQPGDTSQTAETLLVRQEGSVVQYMSPARDEEPFKRTMAMNTEGLAAAYALLHPGGFAEQADYKGDRVLVTGRAVDGAPWVVVRKIDIAEAFSATNNRIRSTIIVAVLLGLILIAGFVAVWRHGTSVRTIRALEETRRMTAQLHSTKQFLEVVTDENPGKIIAVDPEGNVSFINANALPADAAYSREDLVGKNLVAVLGPIQAKVLLEKNAKALEEKSKLSHIFTDETEGGAPRLIQAFHIPIAESTEGASSVLMILQDVTELFKAKERSERTMRNLVTTLVSLLDRRDPYSAHQSQKVAEVSVAIAREMGLEDGMIQTVDLAGNLLNLGKILVPPEILTKPGQLTDSELKQVREAIHEGIHLLEGVEFEVPVVDAMRDHQERWDGGGYPRGVKGEDIHMGARIIAVANAFVSMVSPRAHREALGLEQATKLLTNQAGAAYDMRPVSALCNYIFNKGGMEQWK